jgi:hypothetical protein
VEKFYKVLNEDGSCFHGGKGKWPLPNGEAPGAWMPRIDGTLVACYCGYHVLTQEQLVFWLGPAIFDVQVEDVEIRDKEKCVCRRARLLKQLTTWNERTARLFAADCAEHVLPIFTKKRPSDDRPKLAIIAARDYAEGRISLGQLTAARNAAGDAAKAAAEAAASTASLAADAAFWTTASLAVNIASWAAASWAAEAAGREAERKWQAQRLLYYLGIPIEGSDEGQPDHSERDSAGGV